MPGFSVLMHFETGNLAVSYKRSSRLPSFSTVSSAGPFYHFFIANDTAHFLQTRVVSLLIETGNWIWSVLSVI
jgi:hypothetical protein